MLTERTRIMEGPMVKDLRQGMKSVTLTVIVLEVGPAIPIKEREVRTLKVADGTACINLSVWDEPGALIQPGDIIRLTKANINVFRNCLTVHSGKNGEIEKLGDFCMVFNEQLNMSEPNLELAGGVGMSNDGKNALPRPTLGGGVGVGGVPIMSGPPPLKSRYGAPELGAGGPLKGLPLPSQQQPPPQPPTKMNNKPPRSGGGGLKGPVPMFRSDRR